MFHSCQILWVKLQIDQTNIVLTLWYTDIQSDNIVNIIDFINALIILYS